MTLERATALPDSTTYPRLRVSTGLKLSQPHRGDCLLSSGSGVRIPPGTPHAKAEQLPYPKNTRNVVLSCSPPFPKDISCQSKENAAVTLFEALTAYRICAQAEGKSPKTVRWITSSVTHFSDFLGPDRQNINDITGNDLRQFIIDLQQRPKFLNHPFNKPRQKKISARSIETYARAIRAFFSYLYREEMIDKNPMQKVKMPRVPRIAVPTFSQKEVEMLLSHPDKKTDTGFRDYALILTLVDSNARLSETAFLEEDDVNLENGYLRVMGKGGKER